LFAHSRVERRSRAGLRSLCDHDFAAVRQLEANVVKGKLAPLSLSRNFDTIQRDAPLAPADQLDPNRRRVVDLDRLFHAPPGRSFAIDRTWQWTARLGECACVGGDLAIAEESKNETLECKCDTDRLASEPFDADDRPTDIAEAEGARRSSHTGAFDRLSGKLASCLSPSGSSR
jgi:hypothetical protein